MKTIALLGLAFLCSGAFAADCVTTPRGKIVCAKDGKAAVVNPSTGAVTTTQSKPSGVTTAQNNNGTKAAYNPNTGNAAVSQTGSNGVATAQTSRGGEAKTKNGKGVVQGPNGTTCAKGIVNSGCKKL